MSKKTIVIKTIEGEKSVPELYRNGNMVVTPHYLIGQRKPTKDFSITLDPVGLSFGEQFPDLQKAIRFADFVSAIPEFRSITCPDDARRIDAKIVQSMRHHAEDLRLMD